MFSTDLSPILRATIAAHPPLTRAAQDDLAHRLCAARSAATSAALDVAPRATRRLVMLSAALAASGWTAAEVEAWEATHGAEAHDSAPLTRRTLLAALWAADPDQHTLLALQAVALDCCDDLWTSPRSSAATVARVTRARRDMLSAAADLRRLEDRMVRHNLGLAAQGAARRRGCGVPFDDLMQEACRGLLAAVRRYDPERGFCLSTCAAWWVRHYVTRHVEDHGRTIRLPVHLHGFIRAVRRAEDALRDPVTFADPSDAAIAARLGAAVEKVASARRAALSVLSTEDRAHRNVDRHDDPRTAARTVADTIADDSLPDPTEAIDAPRRLAVVNAAIRRLPARTREAVVLRHTHGGGDDGATYKDIGVRLNLSRGRAQQLVAEGVQALRMAVG